MQWLDKILKFFSKLFTSNAFKKKYKTTSIKKLPKILDNNSWEVIDIRNKISYDDHHLKSSKNIPSVSFNQNYYKKIKKNKKVLLINNDYRSDLSIYKTLRKKGFKVSILYGGYKEIRNNPDLDKYTKVVYM